MNMLIVPNVFPFTSDDLTEDGFREQSGPWRDQVDFSCRSFLLSVS